MEWGWKQFLRGRVGMEWKFCGDWWGWEWNWMGTGDDGYNICGDEWRWYNFCSCAELYFPISFLFLLVTISSQALPSLISLGVQGSAIPEWDLRRSPYHQKFGCILCAKEWLWCRLKCSIPSTCIRFISSVYFWLCNFHCCVRRRCFLIFSIII